MSAAANDENVKTLNQEMNLRAWQRLLRTDRAQATAQVNSVINRLYEGGIRHWEELSRYRSQMLNGVAVPTDFTQSTRA